MRYDNKDGEMMADKNSRMMGKMSPTSEIKGIMKTPKAPGEKHMGGVKKGDVSADMGKAVKHLNMETERGSHRAKIGSYDMEC
jgi:hypothetical protein